MVARELVIEDFVSGVMVKGDPSSFMSIHGCIAMGIGLLLDRGDLPEILACKAPFVIAESISDEIVVVSGPLRIVFLAGHCSYLRELHFLNTSYPEGNL